MTTAEPQYVEERLQRIENHLGLPPYSPEPEPEPTPTNVPQNFTATADQSANTIALQWDAVTGASGYSIYEDYYHGQRTYVTTVTTTSSVRGPLQDDFLYGYSVSSIVDGVESETTPVAEVALGTPTNSPTPSPEPEPEPDPTTPSAPVGSTLLFSDDFSSGLGKWGTIQQEGYNSGPSGYTENYRMAIVDGALRFELRPGDVPPFGGGERTEITGPHELDVYEGDERWYEFDLMFEDFPPPEGITSGGHMIVMQWHTGSGSPLLTLNVDGYGNFTVFERWSNPEIIGPCDNWVQHRYVVHVKFSQSSSVGFVEVYRDGELVVPKTYRANMRDSDNYFKMGIYRAQENSTQALRYDNFKVYAP